MKNPDPGVTYYYEADIINVYRDEVGSLKEHIDINVLDSYEEITGIGVGSGDADNTVKWYITFSNDKTSQTSQVIRQATQTPSISSITASGTALPTSKAAGTYTIKVNQNSWTKAYGEEYRLFSNDPSGAAWDSGWTQSDSISKTFTAPVNHYIWVQIRNISATSSLQGVLTIT